MTCYDGTGRKCGEVAEFVLNDGQSDVPGCYMCHEHALEVLKEYHDKLNYHWFGIPIDKHGRKTSEPYLHPNTNSGGQMTEVKYPNVKVKLVGQDGNAFSIIGRARKAMRNAGLTSKQIKEFTDEAMNSDYSNVLATCMKYFEVS